VKYFKCKSCENVSFGPPVEGVEISCGAFKEYSFMDAQDALDHGVRPDWDKALKLGDIRLASVSSCKGEMVEITEEEANEFADRMAESIQFKGVRNKNER
jgi:hypothetical protein